MQFKALLLVAAASLATAATTSASYAQPTGCQAQNVFEACKSNIQGQVNSCKLSDYQCLCDAYNAYLTCYNQCPSDVGVGIAQSQRDQACANAAVYGTTAAVATPTATSRATSSADDSSESSATSTRASSSSQTANVAVGLDARGLMALAAAGAVAML